MGIATFEDRKEQVWKTKKKKQKKFKHGRCDCYNSHTTDRDGKHSLTLSFLFPSSSITSAISNVEFKAVQNSGLKTNGTFKSHSKGPVKVCDSFLSFIPLTNRLLE